MGQIKGSPRDTARMQPEEQVTALTHTEVFTHARLKLPRPTMRVHTHTHTDPTVDLNTVNSGKAARDGLLFVCKRGCWERLSLEFTHLSSELRKTT